MNYNSTVFPEHSASDHINCDQNRTATQPWRSRLTGAAEKAQNGQATHLESIEHANHGEQLGTPGNGWSDSNGDRLGKRLLRVLIIAACYFVLEIVAKALTVVQFIFVAWQKRPHPGMQRLGTIIAEYMFAMWRYSTFASDQAPWPFNS